MVLRNCFCNSFNDIVLTAGIKYHRITHFTTIIGFEIERERKTAVVVYYIGVRLEYYQCLRTGVRSSAETNKFSSGLCPDQF